MKCGNATIVEFISEALVPERPLNYYVTMSAMDPRAFDMLLGAVFARALELRRYQPRMRARVYVPCRPSDTAILHALMDFGFQNDDAELRVRKAITHSNTGTNPPVGIDIEPVTMQSADDITGLLQRINQFTLIARSTDWVARLRDSAQHFIVYGAWQGDALIGEAVMTVYGAEGHIEHIYTLPEFRERGVATALLDHAGRELLANGVRLLSSEVWQRNRRAVYLFHKSRFENSEPTILYPGIDL